jgi:hypothetical protein
VDEAASLEEKKARASARAVRIRPVTEIDVLGVRADERTRLAGFLDWQRALVVHKVEGLPTAEASTTMTPTGLSPLGIVAHLAAVEVGWFVETFAGEPVDETWEDHGSFRLRSEDTVDSVVGEYCSSCDRSRTIVASAASLDALSAKPDEFRGPVTLRWVLLHMLEETARHAGHLDIMREAIDGKTGD